jgi:hypothetical protein
LPAGAAHGGGPSGGWKLVEDAEPLADPVSGLREHRVDEAAVGDRVQPQVHPRPRCPDDLTVLSALHDLDDDAGQVAEERVCHAFAGLILVPDQVVERILAGRPPEARQLREVFTASSGSLEACAVRLAEYLPGNGYVVLAEPSGRRIRFASPSPGASYQWGRHTPLPARHPLWRAQTTGTYRGQGQGRGG